MTKQGPELFLVDRRGGRTQRGGDSQCWSLRALVLGALSLAAGHVGAEGERNAATRASPLWASHPSTALSTSDRSGSRTARAGAGTVAPSSNNSVHRAWPTAARCVSCAAMAIGTATAP